MKILEWESDDQVEENDKERSWGKTEWLVHYKNRVEYGWVFVAAG